MGRRPAAPIMATCSPRSLNPGPIVVGVERSERSRDAARPRPHARPRRGTRLILVAVYPVDGRSAVMPPAPTPRRWRRRPRPRSSGSRARSAGVGARAARGAVHFRHPRPAARSRRRRTRWRSSSGPPTAARSDRSSPAASASACCTARPAPSPSRRAATGRTPPRPIRRIGVGFVATPEADEALCAAVGIALRTGAAIRAAQRRRAVALTPSTSASAWATPSSSRPPRDDLAEPRRAPRRRRVPGRDRRRGRRRLRRRRARAALRRGRPARLRLARARPARPRDARQRLGGRAAQGALPGPRRPPRSSATASPPSDAGAGRRLTCARSRHPQPGRPS